MFMNYTISEYLLEGEISKTKTEATNFITKTYPNIHNHKKLYDMVQEFIVKGLEKNIPLATINKDLMSEFYNGLVLAEKRSDEY